MAFNDFFFHTLSLNFSENLIVFYTTESGIEIFAIAKLKAKGNFLKNGIFHGGKKLIGEMPPSCLPVIIYFFLLIK